MAVELSQKDMVQATREVHDEIGNDPELARQNNIGMMQKLSRQNELLRKGTGLIQSVAENQRRHRHRHHRPSKDIHRGPPRLRKKQRQM